MTHVGLALLVAGLALLGGRTPAHRPECAVTVCTVPVARDLPAAFRWVMDTIPRDTLRHAELAASRSVIFDAVQSLDAGDIRRLEVRYGLRTRANQPAEFYLAWDALRGERSARVRAVSEPGRARDGSDASFTTTLALEWRTAIGRRRQLQVDLSVWCVMTDARCDVYRMEAADGR